MVQPGLMTPLPREMKMHNIMLQVPNIQKLLKPTSVARSCAFLREFNGRYSSFYLIAKKNDYR